MSSFLLGFKRFDLTGSHSSQIWQFEAAYLFLYLGNL
jgi:hypothetical protein